MAGAFYYYCSLERNHYLWYTFEINKKTITTSWPPSRADSCYYSFAAHGPQRATRNAKSLTSPRNLSRSTLIVPVCLPAILLRPILTLRATATRDRGIGWDCTGPAMSTEIGGPDNRRGWTENPSCGCGRVAGKIAATIHGGVGCDWDGIDRVNGTRVPGHRRPGPTGPCW